MIGHIASVAANDAHGKSTTNRQAAHHRQSIAVALMTLVAAPSLAEQFGPLEISGFLKEEMSFCDNCTQGVVNPSSYDPRGVLSPPVPMLNQGAPSGHRSSNLGLAMLTAGLTHEFDNALMIEAKASGRERNNAPDIYGQYLLDGHVGISYPTLGSVQVGTLPTRTWTRSDAFAYPVGLSTSWAESGAGYSVVPRGIRIASKEYELPVGKIRLEGTYGTASKEYPLNASAIVTPPPTPSLFETFIQYSNDKHLIELTYQQSTGGVQSSFSKGALYGAQGNTNGGSGLPAYHVPHEDVTILEGNYYPNPVWQFTYGLKRSEWSGQQQQCDYGPISANAHGCFFDQGGFNYAIDGAVHHAIEYDAFGGVLYHLRLWTFTAAATHMNKAYVHTPTEYGQDNTATFMNLGIYRKVPEVYKNFEVYGGLGKILFGRQGPAPLSMPNNNADGGVDPRTSRSGNGVTIGANVLF